MWVKCYYSIFIVTEVCAAEQQYKILLGGTYVQIVMSSVQYVTSRYFELVKLHCWSVILNSDSEFVFKGGLLLLLLLSYDRLKSTYTSNCYNICWTMIIYIWGKTINNSPSYFLHWRFNLPLSFCPQSGIWWKQIHCVQTQWKGEYLASQ